MADILPDSRTKRRTGSIPSKLGNLIPIYCAQCGKPHGRVPETMITFAFALCQPCADSGLGDLAHFYQEPDAAFFDRVAEAMFEDEAIRSVIEKPDADPADVQIALAKAIDDSSTPLAKLAKEWQASVRREM